MKKAVFFIIGILIFTGIIASCITEKEEEVVETRINFIENKNVFEQKESFNLLSSEERSSLWISKIDQIKELDLPKNHIDLINQLEYELKKNGYNELHLNERFLSITKILFNEIPSEDIYQMFFTLEDYNFPKEGYNFKSGFYSLDASDFLSEKTNMEKASFSSKRRACNCRWLCSGSGIYDYLRNCDRTSYGCGLLWLWSCTDVAY